MSGPVRDLDLLDQVLPSEQGTFMLIPKEHLHVDQESYQRALRDGRVAKIAKAWSWPGCGALTVGRRSDGTFFVIDGQHRKVAADRRSDVSALPCLVFNTPDIRDEAKAFLVANTLRGPLSARDKFAAQNIAELPVAQLAKTLIDKTGRKLAATSSTTTFSCLSTLIRCLDDDQEALLRIWDMVVSLCAEDTFDNRILSALFYCQKNAVGTSVSDEPWRSILLKLGATSVKQAIHRETAVTEKGGEKVGAAAMVRLANKGRRRNFLKVKNLQYLIPTEE